MDQPPNDDNYTAEIFAMVRDNGRIMDDLRCRRHGYPGDGLPAEQDLQQPCRGGAHHQDAEGAEGPGSPEGTSVWLLERHLHDCVLPGRFRLRRRRCWHPGRGVSEDS
ncbi:MAG: hypothetical protein ACK56I_18760, partial [bacterium]